jgi:hypothetical protein
MSIHEPSKIEILSYAAPGIGRREAIWPRMFWGLALCALACEVFQASWTLAHFASPVSSPGHTPPFHPIYAVILFAGTFFAPLGLGGLYLFLTSFHGRTPRQMTRASSPAIPRVTVTDFQE